MVRVISEKNRVARKDYADDSWDVLSQCNLTGMLSFSERKAIVLFKKAGCWIRKGDTYIEQRNVYDGHIYTFRTLPALMNICSKYDLYPED